MGLNDNMAQRNWFVTGACGTVGRELLRQLEKLNPRNVVAIDNNESELFFVNEDYRSDDRFKFFVCDLRDRDEIAARMAGAEVVVHAAALSMSFSARSRLHRRSRRTSSGHSRWSMRRTRMASTCLVHIVGQGGQPDQCHGNFQIDGGAADQCRQCLYAQ